jgi:hypothetical protein
MSDNNSLTDAERRGLVALATRTIPNTFRQDCSTMNVTQFPRRRPVLAVVKSEQPPAPRDVIEIKPRRPMHDAGRRAYAAEKLADAIRVCAVVFDRDELIEHLQTHIAGQQILAQREARQ